MDGRMDGEMDCRMDGGMDGGMDCGMDRGMNGHGRWVDAGWTVPIILERDGHGRRTGWSRKVDGMVTEGGRDGHGKWSKTKDSL